MESLLLGPMLEHRALFDHVEDEVLSLSKQKVHRLLRNRTLNSTGNSATFMRRKATIRPSAQGKRGLLGNLLP